MSKLFIDMMPETLIKKPDHQYFIGCDCIERPTFCVMAREADSISTVEYLFNVKDEEFVATVDRLSSFFDTAVLFDEISKRFYQKQKNLSVSEEAN